MAEKKLICKENKEFYKKSSSLRFLGIWPSFQKKTFFFEFDQIWPIFLYFTEYRQKNAKNGQKCRFYQKYAELEKQWNKFSKIELATFFRNLTKFSKKKFFFDFGQIWPIFLYFTEYGQKNAKNCQKCRFYQKYAELEKQWNKFSKIELATFFRNLTKFSKKNFFFDFGQIWPIFLYFTKKALFGGIFEIQMGLSGRRNFWPEKFSAKNRPTHIFSS